jgi:branched-chain amino acid transport system permease protein
LDAILVAEQALNGLQLGVMLFLIAAGLTLVFGIMNFVNLAHGSLYMIGAFAAASALRLTGSFALAVLSGLAAATLTGFAIEAMALRKLYLRDHLDQVLGTFGLLLFFNEAARIVWGNSPLYMSAPDVLSGFVNILPGTGYPAYRLAIMAVGLLVGAWLFLLISRTRLGMLIRAGAANREMVSALGVNVTRLFAGVFALGAGLAGLAGVMMAPIVSVQVGMGEPILILAFVVVVIGGLGSIRGAFVGAMLVGLIDSFGRSLLPLIFGFTAGPALSSMLIYLLMAVMLAFRPQGLFPAPASAGGELPGAHLAPPLNVPPLLVLGIVATVLLIVPMLGETYYTRLITRIMVFGLAALSLEIIFGFGGMVSFGHAAFLGVGAYTVGILAFHGNDNALIAWPAAIVCSSLAATAIGAISLRTSGIYFIMITLAFGQMLYFLGVGLDTYGGDDGLPLRAHSTIDGLVRLNDPVALYYTALALLGAAIYGAYRLVGSSFGLALRGIRDNERRMRALGFATYRHRLKAFTIAGGLCGLAGALLVNVDSYVGPATLHWFVSGELMIMVILGGAATLLGPLLGAATYLLLKEVLSSLTEHWLALFGPLLLVLVLVARGGLFNALTARLRHHD